jgi:hypothetical protein
MNRSVITLVQIGQKLLNRLVYDQLVSHHRGLSGLTWQNRTSPQNAAHTSK